MFEILEHTADIGFRARGRTMAELFAEAAMVLSAIYAELDQIEARLEYPIEARGEDRESLLVNWLGEVLFWIDGRRVVFSRFRVDAISTHEVRGLAFGEPYDPTRHRAKLLVKAVTYHQLKVTETAEGWTAEVYLDV